MAGSNQAGNYSGMFNQIGQSLGTTPDISGLLRNIENAGRPDADPSDRASMLKLADWQNKKGRTQEAATSVGMLSEQRLAAAEAAETDKQKVRDTYATQLAMYEQGRDRALAAGDDFEALSYDRKIENLRAPTEATQKMQTTALQNGAKSFEAREAQGRDAAAQKYIENEKVIGAYKAQQAHEQPGTDKHQNLGRNISQMRAIQEQTLREPGMAEAVKKAGDDHAGIAANAAATEQVTMDKVLQDVASQTTAAGFERYLQANPAMREYAEPWRQALKEHEESLASLPPEVTETSNENYTTDLMTEVNANEELSQVEKDTWKDRFLTALHNQSGTNVARQRLLELGKEWSLYKRTLPGAERAETAFNLTAMKEIVPSVLRQFRDEDPNASHWFGGTEIDDIADDILGNEQLLQDLSSRAYAEGATDIESLREWLLKDMGRRDEGLFTWLGADNAYTDYRQKRGDFDEVKEVEIDGKTVKIKKKGTPE